MKSDLLKLLICILIVVFLYNCINSEKIKNIEGFETLSSEEIKIFKNDLISLKEDLDKDKTLENPKKILQKEIYDNESIRKVVNYILRSKYLALFLEKEEDRTDIMKNLPTIKDYEDLYSNKELWTLYSWIYFIYEDLVTKLIFDVILPIKDLNENKLLFKKTMNDIFSEITSKTTEQEKEIVNEEHVNIYLNAPKNEEVDISNNYLLDIDIDKIKDLKVNKTKNLYNIDSLLGNESYTNIRNFKSRRSPRDTNGKNLEPKLNLSEFMELVKKDYETKNLINKTIKNTKKIADEINNGKLSNIKLDVNQIGRYFTTDYLTMFTMSAIRGKRVIDKLKNEKNDYKNNIEAITRISNNTTSKNNIEAITRISNNTTSKTNIINKNDNNTIVSFIKKKFI